MATMRRTYTAPELNALLNQVRLPTTEHHAAIQLLMAIALFLDAAYALELHDHEECAPMTSIVPILQRHLMVGMDLVLREGVEVVVAPSSPAVN